MLYVHCFRRIIVWTTNDDLQATRSIHCCRKMVIWMIYKRPDTLTDPQEWSFGWLITIYKWPVISITPRKWSFGDWYRFTSDKRYPLLLKNDSFNDLQATKDIHDLWRMVVWTTDNDLQKTRDIHGCRKMVIWMIYKRPDTLTILQEWSFGWLITIYKWPVISITPRKWLFGDWYRFTSDKRYPLLLKNDSFNDLQATKDIHHLSRMVVWTTDNDL